MRFKIALATFAGLWMTAFYSAAGAQSPVAASRSALDGVYTDEQAKRGETVYAQECATCHGASLEGMDMAPALSGGAFLGNWTGTTVGDLFERIRTTMPDGNPGKLTRPQTADVVAFILKGSKMPAGKTELPGQTEVLKQIKFEVPKL